MGIQTMGSPRKAQSLGTQGSFLYGLTLNEVQHHLGEPLNSMNLDDLLKNVFPQEVNQSAPMELGSSTTGRPGSRLLSKKTVDEAWREIQQQKKSGGDLRRQGTLGEMTLEDFLLKAGVVAAEVSEEGRSDQGTLGFATWSPWMQQQNQQSGMRDYAPSRSVPQVMGMGLVAGYSEGRQVNASSPLLGTGSDPSSSGGKRLALEHVAEKTVERRKKRMIKNRESAARSRARKQAYTNELENKILLLEEENERLRKQKELDTLLYCAPVPEPKHQLRRSFSGPF